MKPAARLAVWGAAAIVGAVLCVVGTRIPWYTTTSADRTVDVPGLGTTRFPGEVTHAAASAVVPAAPGIAIVVLLACVLVFLVGTRTRVGLLLAVTAGSIGLAVLSAAAFEADTPPGTRVERRAGPDLVRAGAALAGVSALVALRDARAGRLRMPESGPEERAGR